MESETPAVNDLPAKLRQDALAHEEEHDLVRASVAYADGLRQAADELEAALARERDRNSNVELEH